MSYATASFYYGLPLIHKSRSNLLKQMFKDTSNKNIYSPDLGVHIAFSEGDSQFLFGVSLDYQINECSGFVDVAPLSMLLKEEHTSQYDKLFSALAPELQSELKEYGRPKVFMVWSSS